MIWKLSKFIFVNGVLGYLSRSCIIVGYDKWLKIAIACMKMDAMALKKLVLLLWLYPLSHMWEVPFRVSWSCAYLSFAGKKTLQKRNYGRFLKERQRKKGGNKRQWDGGTFSVYKREICLSWHAALKRELNISQLILYQARQQCRQLAASQQKSDFPSFH